ncbi:MAG TPA: GntR family transcriptional regulator YhfZ [Bacillota bacterium]|nr:GntR family transcriptional regulator YhfZ [Bacillota bacterium]
MSRIWESLFSKNGLAARKIARELIYIKKEERIPRIDDFVKKMELGRGTVQGALKVLEDLRAIQLESRGHLGTFLVYKDIHILKEIAGVGAMMGAMPLPYSPNYEGLATGLMEVSSRMNDRINLAYMRGSKQRIEGLKSRRYDFIVMSELSAEEEMADDLSLKVAVNFGKGTYVTSHKIFLASSDDNKIEPGMKVGIDYTSIDQYKLTLLECDGLDVELVPINYMQLFENLQNGTLDAAVWNLDEIRANKAFKTVDFKNEQAKQVADKASASVLLIEKDRVDVNQFLARLDTQEILAIQQQVVNKEKLPQY